tara:strand:+ start:3568 stop:3909 length:342 start_codon:yes stop_codon:yes gene_type:complete
MTEARIQEIIVNYINLQYPKARYCASLGGIRTGKKQGAKARKTGYVKGFPDLQITEARKGYFGLFIELKKDKKAYPSPAQKIWLKDLNERGYLALCCKGLDATIEAIDNYLGE